MKTLQRGLCWLLFAFVGFVVWRVSHELFLIVVCFRYQNAVLRRLIHWKIHLSVLTIIIGLVLTVLLNRWINERVGESIVALVLSTFMCWIMAVSLMLVAVMKVWPMFQSAAYVANSDDGS